MRFLRCLTLAFTLCATSFAQDWTNLGGNGGRNGFSPTVGPIEPDLLWADANDPAVVAHAVFVDATRVVTIRQRTAPPAGGPFDDPIVAYDLETGAVQWETLLDLGPGGTGSSAWIGGISGGLVFASRSDSSTAESLQAFDAATGTLVWTSAVKFKAVETDGLSIDANGDLFWSERFNMARLDGQTGATIWNQGRSGNNDGFNGVALGPDGVFYDEVIGLFISSLAKHDKSTGNFLYSSTSFFAGVFLFSQPFVSADGSMVYITNTDTVGSFVFAFEDTGTDLNLAWQVQIANTTGLLSAIDGDGSVLTISRANEVLRLDGVTGVELARSAALTSSPGGLMDAKITVDGFGTVTVSNGSDPSSPDLGQLWVLSPDLLTTHFTLPLIEPGDSAQALGSRGTLLVADLDGLRAYRCPAQAGATLRNAGSNSPSLSVNDPFIGQSLAASVDLGGTTGHAMARVFGYASPLQFPLAGGQVLLLNVLDPLGELFGFPFLPGPTPTFSGTIPSDPNLCGFTLSMQAVHLGGVTPFALSNAQDLVIGQ